METSTSNVPTESKFKRGNVKSFIVIGREFCDTALRQKVFNNPLSGKNCTLFYVGMYTNTVYKMYYLSPELVSIVYTLLADRYIVYFFAQELYHRLHMKGLSKIFATINI